MIRVLVVDDSLTLRRAIRGALEADTRFRVVGEAADGKEAVAQVEELRPDVVTMDMSMPLMSGLAATEFLMAHRPTPILVVSGSMNRGEVYHTYDALAAGAVDVLEKPTPEVPPDQWEQDLRDRVARVSRIRVITHVRGLRAGRCAPAPEGRSPGPADALPSPPRALTPRGSRTSPEVVAIGASTGGPGALLELVRGLPHDFPVPILVVLHISDAFASAFGDWLGAQTEREVHYARDRESLPEGPGAPVLLAPPGRHLTLRRGRLRLEHGPERHSCRPSVDVLFESIAAEVGPRGVGVLLTGMGKDGAAGLLELRRAGAPTLAQDRASSTVWGMPGEAVRLEAAETVLPPAEIAHALFDLAVHSTKGNP